MKEMGGTLLLAGDSMHSAPSMGSGGMLPQENFENLALRWILRRYDSKVICLPQAAPAS